ncbi:MAG: phosphatase PAP2 family protein [Desulfosarcinaceae bacterium]
MWTVSDVREFTLQRLDNRPQHRFFIGLILCSILAMTAAAPVDLDVTAALGRHPWPALTDFMGRTLFEGQLPGANDPFVLLLLAALAVHLTAWARPGNRKWNALRPQAGFILISALVVAFLMMHVIKLSQGRARPDLVFNHDWPFTPWFAIGPHFIGDGIFRGSFPSGHTAQTFATMAFGYALACDPYAGHRQRLLGVAWGVAALGMSLVMGVARCMSLSHWLTDVVGSVCLGWIVMHGIYFYLLRVPGQRIYYQTHGDHLPMPAFWEMRLGGWLTLSALGLLEVLNGLRALWLGRSLWLAWLMPLGAALIYAALRKAVCLHRRLASGLAAPADRG